MATAGSTTVFTLVVEPDGDYTFTLSGPLDHPLANGDDDELLAVHDALDAFAAEHPRKAEVVKLHYFTGLTLAEAADVLGISHPTAKRDWAFARGWLRREIRQG